MVAALLRAAHQVKDELFPARFENQISGLSPLHLACAKGASIAVVSALLAAGAPVNVADEGNNGFTPLMWAVSASACELVRLLLSTQANVNARNMLTGKAAIHVVADALHKRASEIAQLLLAAKADPQQRCQGEYTSLKTSTLVTALQIARVKGLKSVARLMMLASMPPPFKVIKSQHLGSVRLCIVFLSCRLLMLGMCQ